MLNLAKKLRFSAIPNFTRHFVAFIGVCVPLGFNLAIAQSTNSALENSSAEATRDGNAVDEQQQAQTSQEDRQETVVVSGTGIARSIDLWVNPVAVLDRDDIVQKLHATLGDTVADQPGVSTSFFGPGASLPIVRGLGAERVLVLSNGLGTVDAAVASPDHQVLADGIEAERIEILRGPAALAYGGQAIGGGVNVFDSLIAREKPAKNFTGEAFSVFSSVSDGNDSGLIARGTQDDQQIVYSFSASLRDHSDYSIPGEAESEYLHADEDDDDEDEHGTHGKAENTNVSASSAAAGLSWIGDRGFIGASIRSYSSDYGLPGHAHHEEEEEEEEEEHGSPTLDLEQTKLEMHGEWGYDRKFFSKISGAVSFADYAHTEIEDPDEAGTKYENSGYEASFRASHDLEFALVTGATFSNKKLSAVGDEAFLTDTETSRFGVFAHAAELKSTGLAWEAGLRLENSSFDNVKMGSKDFSLFSASGGITWQDDAGLILGGQLSLTERSPNETELFALGAHLATRQYEVGDENLSKEKGLSLEGSVRWAGDSVKMGVNAFAYNFDNFIYLTPGTHTPSGSTQPVDEIDHLPVYKFEQNNAEFRGGEIFVVWDATDRGWLDAAWQMRFDLDFVNAQFDNGSDVPLIPPTSALFRIKSQGERWKVETSVKLASDKDAITTSGTSPTTRQFKTDGYNEIGLYGELDLSALGYEFGTRATAFLDIRNASDEDIRYSTSVLKDYIPAPGANIRAGIRWNF